MIARRFFCLRFLTDPPASRLASSGRRPNALPLHNVRNRRPYMHSEGPRSQSPAIWPSSRQALGRSTKLINRIDKDRNSSICSTFVKALRPRLGGARRDRTDDLMLAKHALSQLSYGPDRPAGARRPKWWAWEDLNLRPHAYQARALTN
jgi:hypothetical protein